MVTFKLSYFFLSLLCLINADVFTPYARYIMTSKYLTADGKKIKDLTGESKSVYELSGSPIPAQCEYTKIQAEDSIRLIGDLRDFVSYFTTDITINIWYYNEDFKKGGRPFSFIDSLGKLDDGYQIMVQYNKLQASYVDFQGKHNKKYDFSFPTPYFWNLFTFHWSEKQSTVTWSIYTQNFSKKITANNPWYEMPNFFSLGYNTNGYFYEVQVVKSAFISEDKFLHEYSVTLIDDNGNETPGAFNTDIGPCHLKHPEMGCLSIRCCESGDYCDIFEEYGNCKQCNNVISELGSE